MPTLREVYEPGSKVYVGHDPADIRGEVIDIRICGTELAIEYHVAWWEGRTRRREWFAAQEVRLAPESRTMQVGFVSKPPASETPIGDHLLARAAKALGACDDVEDHKLKRGLLFLALQALRPFEAAAKEAAAENIPTTRRVPSINGRFTYGDMRAIARVLELADR